MLVRGLGCAQSGRPATRPLDLERREQSTGSIRECARCSPVELLRIESCARITNKFDLNSIRHCRREPLAGAMPEDDPRFSGHLGAINDKSTVWRNTMRLQNLRLANRIEQGVAIHLLRSVRKLAFQSAGGGYANSTYAFHGAPPSDGSEIHPSVALRASSLRIRKLLKRWQS